MSYDRIPGGDGLPPRTLWRRGRSGRGIGAPAGDGCSARTLVRKGLLVAAGEGVGEVEPLGHGRQERRHVALGARNQSALDSTFEIKIYLLQA